MNQEKILKDQEDVAEEVENNMDKQSISGQEFVREYNEMLWQLECMKDKADKLESYLDEVKKNYQEAEAKFNEFKSIAPDLVKLLEKTYKKETNNYEY